MDKPKTTLLAAEYIPFNEQWERAVLKLTKKELVAFLRKALIQCQVKDNGILASLNKAHNDLLKQAEKLNQLHTYNVGKRADEIEETTSNLEYVIEAYETVLNDIKMKLVFDGLMTDIDTICKDFKHDK
jgi:type IV secretory pathway VirB4 component